MTDVKRHALDMNQRSRFDAFRESWFPLATFIERLVEHQLFDTHLFEIIDRSFNAPWIQSEELSYAIAWRSISSDAEESLAAPSMFGHHAPSFHQLIAEMSLSLHEAICIGIEQVMFGRDETVSLRTIVQQQGRQSLKGSGSDWNALSYSVVQLAAQREVERYRGWDFHRTVKRIKCFLDLEAAHVANRGVPPEASASNEQPFPLVLDRTTRRLKNATPTEARFTDPEFTPDEVKAALEKMDGTLPMPKTVRQAELNLYLAGLNPGFQPTRSEQMIAAMILSKQSREGQYGSINETADSLPRNSERASAAPDSVDEMRSNDEAKFISLPKAFLRHEFGDISDKTLRSKLKELGVRLHPEDEPPNARHSVRLEEDSLVRTKLYREFDRESKLAEWKRSRNGSH